MDDASYSMIHITASASFAISAGVIFFLLRSSRVSVPMDEPNQRSLHTRPVPRIGGLAIMLAITLSWLLTGWGAALAGCAAGLALVSFVDDWKTLSVHVRLAAHMLFACIVLVLYCWQDPLWLLALEFFTIVWLTNLYNFMDGSDGLAGGMTLIGFACYGCAALQAGDGALAAAAFVISAAAAGFLLFNFHPAKTFMGDAGSIPLGFLAAAIGLIGWKRGDWNVLFPVLAFFPFIADATATLIKRLLAGQRVWQAHREHYYQRLIQMGWGHRKTAVAYYVAMALLCLIAYWNRLSATAIEVMIVAVVGLGALCVFRFIDVRWQKSQMESS